MCHWLQIGYNDNYAFHSYINYRAKDMAFFEFPPIVLAGEAATGDPSISC